MAEISKWSFPRGRFPFRVGTTSYVTNGGLVDNLRYLSDKVDEMQLVLFDSENYSNIPSQQEARELAKLSKDLGIALTVHLPVDIELGDPDPAVRRASSELFRRVVGITSPISPVAWIFHAIGAAEFSRTGSLNPARLAAHTERTLEALASLMPVFNSPRDLCIENIHDHFSLEPPIIEAFDTSVCIDIGHLHNYRRDIKPHLSRWRDRARVIHIHATDREGLDHASLEQFPPERLSSILSTLGSPHIPETVTVEVFGNKDFLSSMKCLSCLAPSR